MIKLDMKTGLSKVWEAFNAKELQAQVTTEPNKTGTYSGPCAIGVMMTTEERKIVDHPDGGGLTYADVGLLWERKVIDFPDKDQLADAVKLQRDHDRWLINPSSKLRHDRFVLTLNDLSTKYGVEFPEATAS